MCEQMLVWNLSNPHLYLLKILQNKVLIRMSIYVAIILDDNTLNYYYDGDVVFYIYISSTYLNYI